MLFTDRTACPGTGCPLKTRCLRYRGITHGRFDSFVKAPYDPASGTCQAFDDLDARRPTESQIRTRAYFIWIAAGRPHGQADQHWAEARAELERAFESSLRPA